jgi:uncharacterized membrane protein (UPF0182 family)
MYKIIFILLLFAHILGDFYFQSQKFAEQKEKSIYKLLLHSIFYTLACFIVIIPVINKWLIIAVAFISISHLIIDVLKSLVKGVYKELNEEKDRIFYVIDQFVHLCFIFIASVFVAANCDSLNVFSGVNYIFEIVGINKLQILSLLLLILLVWKPTNITLTRIKCNNPMLFQMLPS